MSIVNNLFKAEIFKVFSFTAFSTLIKMLTSLISVKVLAVVVGPSGVALLGQLSNFSGILMTLGSGGINNGVTKYIAEFNGDKVKISKILSTSTKITLTLSIIIGLILILFSSSFSSLIFNNFEYKIVFIIFGFTLVFYTLNNQLLAILNGFKEYRKYVLINILASVFGLIFTVVLVLIYNLKGALIASISYQSITFFISLILVLKSPWFDYNLVSDKFNKDAAKRLFGYSLMTLISASTVPVSQMIIRSYLSNHLSLSHAGIWEGMNRISGMYLMIITSSLTVYYLPKLAETLETNRLRNEIFKVYKFITPILIFSIITIYIFRHLIISILFTSDFSIMSDLFIFQMIGDFFKMLAWILSFIMVAKAMTAKYIITELIFTCLFVLLSIYFITKSGIIGASIAYMINYIIYFFTMLLIFRKIIFSK